MFELKKIFKKSLYNRVETVRLWYYKLIHLYRLFKKCYGVYVLICIATQITLRDCYGTDLSEGVTVALLYVFCTRKRPSLVSFGLMYEIRISRQICSFGVNF